jgi:hypothetical protein
MTLQPLSDPQIISRWVDASEQLPDIPGWYLGWLLEENIATRVYFSGKEYPEQRRWTDFTKYVQVTHWVPLPKNPRLTEEK